MAHLSTRLACSSVAAADVFAAVVNGAAMTELFAGFGNHLARPLFRERHSADMSEDEALTLIKDALRVSTCLQISLQNSRGGEILRSCKFCQA